MKINLYEIKHLFTSKKNLDDNFIFDSEDIFIDSRIITKNKIFIALKGKNFNANLFIPEVMKQNPKMVVTDNNDLNEGPFLYVECTNKFFMELASFILNKLKAKKIGITGSNGKTTTKELITFFLKNKFPNKVLSTIGNFNNDIGLPLTIMSAKGNEEFVVLEMGTNHPGEIEILADVVKPNISIITNIGDAHIGNYKNQRAIAQEKKNIFKFLKADDFKIIDGKNKFLSELNDSPGKLFLTSEEKSGNEVLNYQNSHW
jgi:UDP-N-acetylmuramoyl-tripeptide--D-alanyl-D-alanine ligase